MSYFKPQKTRKTGPRSIYSLPVSTQNLSRKWGLWLSPVHQKTKGTAWGFHPGCQVSKVGVPSSSVVHGGTMIQGSDNATYRELRVLSSIPMFVFLKLWRWYEASEWIVHQQGRVDDKTLCPHIYSRARENFSDT